MFKQLASLLRKGDTVSVTVALENDTQLRVNVYPKLFTLDGEKSPDRAALNQPLTVAATAEELDAGFGDLLTKFTASATTLRNTLDEAEAAHQAAAKAKSKLATKVEKPKAKLPPRDEAAVTEAAAEPDAGTMDLLAEAEPAAPVEVAEEGEAQS